MSICANCGATLPDTAKFCTACGTPVAPAVPTEIPAQEVPSPEAPVSEVPVSEAPAPEVPVSEAPATEAPISADPTASSLEPEQHSFLQQVPSEAKLVSPNAAEPSPVPPTPTGQAAPMGAPIPSPAPAYQPQAGPNAFAQASPTGAQPQNGQTAFEQAYMSGTRQQTAYQQAYQPKQTQAGPTVFPSDQHPYQQTTYQNFQPGQPAYQNGIPAYGAATQPQQSGYPQNAYSANGQTPIYPNQPYAAAPNGKKSLSTGAIVGITIGIAAAVIIIFIIICILLF